MYKINSPKAKTGGGWLNLLYTNLKFPKFGGIVGSSANTVVWVGVAGLSERGDGAHAEQAGVADGVLLRAAHRAHTRAPPL